MAQKRILDPETKAHIEWIKRGLSIPGKSRAGLARELKLHRSQMTKLVNGTRRLQLSEIATCERYFGLPRIAHRVAGPQNGNFAAVEGLYMRGRISARSWYEPDLPTPSQVAPIMDDRFPISAQYCYQLADNSRDGVFKVNDWLICVDFEPFRKTPQHDDLIVRKSERGGMVNYSLCRAIATVGGIELSPVVALETIKAASKARGARIAEKIISLVIARVTPLV